MCINSSEYRGSVSELFFGSVLYGAVCSVKWHGVGLRSYRLDSSYTLGSNPLNGSTCNTIAIATLLH